MHSKNYIRDNDLLFSSSGEDEFSHPSKIAIVKNNVELAKKHLLFKGSKILEFGCLYGLFTELVNKTTSSHGTGVDLVVTGKFKHLVNYDGKRLPFKNKTFNSFVAFEVLEHLNDPKSSLLELNRILKKGGMGIVSTPNKLMISSFNSGHNSVVGHLKQLLKINPECLGMYSYFELLRLFEETGFSYRLLGDKPFWIKRGFIFLIKKK
ncbi:MAG: methyltransferase domain-containing protein [Candidatus Diapherotrites archaeon]|nr:methyltransferase domain-containing protein [Candidatus Diapherotrites archaeon]